MLFLIILIPALVVALLFLKIAFIKIDANPYLCMSLKDALLCLVWEVRNYKWKDCRGKRRALEKYIEKIHNRR